VPVGPAVGLPLGPAVGDDVVVPVGAAVPVAVVVEAPDVGEPGAVDVLGGARVTVAPEPA
jgi:hypothetical protein